MSLEPTQAEEILRQLDHLKPSEHQILCCLIEFDSKFSVESGAGFGTDFVGDLPDFVDLASIWVVISVISLLWR